MRTRLVDLAIPPGVFRNGTEYQAKNRWYDTSLVRWREGAMRPVGGWGAADWTAGFYTDVGTGLGGTRAGALAWVDNSGNKWAVFGKFNGAIVYDDAGRTYEISSATTGAWTFDTFGEILVGCQDVTGNIVEWDLNTANNFTTVTNSPSNCDAVVVSEERFLFALGAGGEKDRVEWSDRADRTVWAADATNQAGGLTLDTEGEIMFGLQMRGELLIVTTTDCWTATYVGYPDVWSFRRIGSCTAVNRNCGVRVGDAAYWMGNREFYRYHGGFVQRIPCDVSDHVFGEIDDAAFANVFAWDNNEHGEVWWHYSATGSNSRPEKAVALSVLEGHWATHGGLQFSAVVPRGVFDKPLASSYFRPEFDHDFSTDPGYVLGTNWQISGGVLSQTSPTVSSATFTHAPTYPGTVVTVAVTIQNQTTGGVVIQFGDAAEGPIGNGTYYFTARMDDGIQTDLVFTAGGTWDGEITEVIVESAYIMELEKDDEHRYYSETPYAETGPLEVGNGEKRAHVTRVYPDEQDSAELQLTFKTREYPTASETTHTAVTAANPTDVRFSGRQFTMRVEAASTNTDWRSGTHRLAIVERGRR